MSTSRLVISLSISIQHLYGYTELPMETTRLKPRPFA